MKYITAAICIVLALITGSILLENYSSRVLTDDDHLANGEGSLLGNLVPFQLATASTTEYFLQGEARASTTFVTFLKPATLTTHGGSYECSDDHLVVTDHDYELCRTITTTLADGEYNSTYTYTAPLHGHIVSYDFTVAQPRCEDYEEFDKRACFEEHASFDPDAYVARLVNTTMVQSTVREVAISDLSWRLESLPLHEGEPRTAIILQTTYDTGLTTESQIAILPGECSEEAGAPPLPFDMRQLDCSYAGAGIVFRMVEETPGVYTLEQQQYEATTPSYESSPATFEPLLTW